MKESTITVILIIGIWFYIFVIRPGAPDYKAVVKACQAGQTLDCQIGVHDDNGRNASIYKTAYKQATGRDLPPMEK